VQVEVTVDRVTNGQYRRLPPDRRVQAALSLSMAVFIEGAMSFVGIGIRPPSPSLGALLRTSVNFLSQNPWYAVGPIIVVTALVLGFNLIADGLNRGLLRR
jgi:peptide/nickel transport system permease protein